MKAFGQYQSSQAQARAAKTNAKIKKAQAQEMLERMAIQEDRLNERGEAFKAQQLTEYGASGVQIGTGATLIAMEDTNYKINQQVDDMKRDTKFRANQLFAGAEYEMQEASETSKAGAILAGTSLLEGAGSYYKNT